jgi:hypothetical protein
MKKSFKYWSRDDLYNELGVDVVANMPTLTAWLNSDSEISNQENDFLTALSNKAAAYIDNWNEVELREKFIYKVTDLVDFDMPQYKCSVFAERYLKITIKHATLFGFPDWMVASGINKPQHPYFFIHEYKPETEKQLDGRGQLLSVMVATQALNKDDMPVYGCFIHGRMWFFVVLEAQKYAISHSFDITYLDNLIKVVKILKKQKEIIFSRVK